MKREGRHWFSVLVVALYGAIVLFPLFWLMLTSFKEGSEVYTAGWPSHLTLKNYIDVLTTYSIGSFFGNSLFVSATATAIIIMTSTLAVYGLTKFRSRFSGKILAACIALRMIPFVTIVIPLYLMMAKFHLINTKACLIIGNVSFNLPMAIWLLVPFFLDFPDELMEAAAIDGSSRLNTLVRIVLPLSKSAIMVVLIFTFINTWNEFMYALIMNTRAEHMTLPVAIAQLTSRYGPRWDLQSAAAMLYILPVITVTAVFRKQIIGGLTAGAVKG
jgi:multiple sugar transport system permease protein